MLGTADREWTSGWTAAIGDVIGSTPDGNNTFPSYSWLRSPWALTANYASRVANDGTLNSVGNVGDACVVRPAVHLSYSDQPPISPNQLQEKVTYHTGAMDLIDSVIQSNVKLVHRMNTGENIDTSALTYYSVPTVATRLNSITEDMEFTSTIPTATFTSLEEATSANRYVYVKVSNYVVYEVYEVKIIILPADISFVSVQQE
jgi:hypothetical protein